MRISTSIVSLVAALGLGACDVGTISGPGGGGGPGPGGGGNPGDPDAAPAPGTPDAMPPDFTVAMTPPTMNTTLGTEVHYAITVNGMHHMTGDVALTPTGVPASWQATITPATVTLDAAGTATADLKLVIPTDAADLTGAPGVSAAGVPGTHASTAALTVAKEVIVTITEGTGTGAHPFPARIDVLLGTKLRVMDADTTKPHRIHSDATAADGFAHQDNDMNAGQEYDVTPLVGGNTQFRWYCHDHGQGTGVVNLVVH